MFKKLRFSIFIVDVLVLWILFLITEKAFSSISLNSLLLFASLLLLIFTSLRGYDFHRIYSPRWTMTSFSVSLFLSLFLNTVFSFFFRIDLQLDHWGMILYFLIFVNLFNPTFFRFVAGRYPVIIELPEGVDETIFNRINENEYLKPVFSRKYDEKKQLFAYRQIAAALGEMPKELYEEMDGKLIQQDISSKKMTACFLRLVDVCLSFIFLMISSPFFLICSICLLIVLGRPVFYRQKRIGKNGKPFTLYKFRTLKPGEAKVTDIERDHMERSTSVGKILRSLRLDELPQLINCIKGDMSLVGPRPEMPYFNELCQKEIPNYTLRLLVRPGITGWAQTMYKRSDTLDEYRIKTGYDFYYLLHYSPCTYFQSLLFTLDTLVYRKD